MYKPIRVGIVGLGKMGKTRATELERHPNAVVVCGADPASNAYSDFSGIKCFDDYFQVIESDIDAVFVATPNRFTPEIVIRSLDAGKHVFCEKPPGKTIDDIKSIRAAEERNPELKLKFGFNHRYHGGIQEAYRMVRSGRFGEIIWLRGVYGKSGGPGFEEQWRNSKDLSGGGILLDQGIHMVDLFRLFCGDFVEVKSMVSTTYWNIDVEDNAFALLRDERGRTAMLHSTSTQWKHRFNLEICLTGGYISVNGILSSTRSYGDETVTFSRKSFDENSPAGKPREEVIFFDTDPSWEMEVADFLRCVSEGLPITDGNSDQALQAMRLVFSIYENDLM